MLPEKKKLTGDKPYNTKHIQNMLNVVGVNLKFRCIIHIMSANGCRIGSFEELKVGHIQDMPNSCKSLRIYDDHRKEYYTFIHHEAVEALDEYLESRTKKGEIITPESWLIPSASDVNKPVLTVSIRIQMARYAHHDGVQEDEVKKRGRYQIQACHGFKKRFNTIMKSN